MVAVYDQNFLGATYQHASEMFIVGTNMEGDNFRFAGQFRVAMMTETPRIDESGSALTTTSTSWPRSSFLSDLQKCVL